MGVCSCTCKLCNKKFDRYSGYLINISEYAMSALRGKVESDKHYVLCSDCIEKFIDPLNIEFIKFKHKYLTDWWFSSNLVYYLRKLKGTCVKSVEGEHIFIDDDFYRKSVHVIKEFDEKGIFTLASAAAFIFNNKFYLPITFIKVVRSMK